MSETFFTASQLSTLTKLDAAALKAAVKSGHVPKPTAEGYPQAESIRGAFAYLHEITTAKTVVDLAYKLGTYRQLIEMWQKKPDAPEGLDLEEWRLFLSRQKTAKVSFTPEQKESMAAAKLALAQAQASIARREDKRQGGETITKEEGREKFIEALAIFFGTIRPRICGNSVAKAGKDALFIREYDDRAFDEAEDALRSRVEEIIHPLKLRD